MLTRRVFAKVMSLAPAAASMAGNVTGYAGVPGPKSLPPAEPIPDYVTVAAVDSHKRYLNDRVGWFKEMLASGTLDEDDINHCREQALKRLDPDIKALRSFSGIAKLHLQVERNEARLLAVRRDGWRRSLAGTLKELGGMKG